MRMNTLLKGLVGASIAMALAGGAQAAGQDNMAPTATDKTMNDASMPMKTTPKAKKSMKKSKSSMSQGTSGTAGTTDSGAAPTAAGADAARGSNGTGTGAGTMPTTNGK